MIFRCACQNRVGEIHEIVILSYNTAFARSYFEDAGNRNLAGFNQRIEIIPWKYFQPRISNNKLYVNYFLIMSWIINNQLEILNWKYYSNNLIIIHLELSIILKV